MLHFSDTEFARRRAATTQAMEEAGFDALLLFAPESHYWLTGYDTFGYCHFQCMIWDGERAVLLTRSADLRQAQLTSNVEDIRIWRDRSGADPVDDLGALLAELRLAGKRLGVEWDCHGLTALYGRKLAAHEAVRNTGDASALLSPLRLVKSEEELAFVRRAAELHDDALDAGLAAIRPGVDESAVFAAMHQAVYAGGGGAPGNPFVIGGGDHALLCRTQEARGTFGPRDQVTVEWAGTYRHYHVAGMQTVVIGEPRPEHLAMHAAAREALLACEDALRPGKPMSDVFAAHARVLDDAGLNAHRLNACGYALGTRFAPSWMEREMFYADAPVIMGPGMVFFLHMILMDSDSGAAMCLGRSSLIGATGAEPLTRHGLEILRVD